MYIVVLGYVCVCLGGGGGGEGELLSPEVDENNELLEAHRLCLLSGSSF